MTRASACALATRPPVPLVTARAPSGLRTQPTGIPEDIARFSRFVAPRMLGPLSGRELLAGYLRVVELDPTPLVALRIGLSYNAAAMLLWRFRVKLGVEGHGRGVDTILADYYFAAGFAAGRESMR